MVAALLLSETAWLYAISAMSGIALSIGRTPLGWLAVLGIVVSSYLVARLLLIIGMPAAIAYAVQMVAGVLTLYLTLGTQLISGAQGFDMGWIGNLASAPDGEQFPLRAAVGGFIGIALWWRGGRLASTEDIVDSLELSFKLGALVLALAAVVDVFHSADLKIFPVMFLFFASGLAGLGIAHILPSSHSVMESRAWPRIIGGVVGVVLLSGLLFSLLQRSMLSLISEPVMMVLRGLALVVFFVIVFPIGSVIIWLLGLLKAIFGRFAAGEEGADQDIVGQGQGFGETLRQIREGTGEEGTALWLQVLEWTLVALLVLIVLYFLALAFKRRLRWRRDHAEGARDSVVEDADPASDLANLLLNLIPRRLLRKAGQPRRFVLPEDDSDVVEVFRMYFGLLVLAEKRGYPRPPTETPVEYQRTLETLFPENLVRMVTAAFNRACYGHHPAPREQIEEMRAALDRIG